MNSNNKDQNNYDYTPDPEDLQSLGYYEDFGILI